MVINQYSFSNMFYIYSIENQINGKIYIGRTKDRRDRNARWHEHLADARKGNTKMPIHKAIRKYGKENFNYTLFEAFSTKEEACLSEIYWIAHLKEMNVELYNASLGGDGGNGWPGKRTEEQKAKMHKFPKGHVPWSQGVKFSSHIKNKISSNAFGRKISDDQRIEIKKLYASGKYSQYDLADQFGVGQDQICRIINNKTGWISRGRKNGKK